MCRNHKNDHLLCGILCTRALIIDGIKALPDSWGQSERNWNSSSKVFFSLSSLLVLVLCLEPLILVLVLEMMGWTEFKSEEESLREKAKLWQILKRSEMWVDDGLWLIATEGIIKAKKYGMYSGLSARGLSGGEAEGAHQVGNFHLWLLLANSAISFSTWRNDDTYYPMRI